MEEIKTAVILAGGLGTRLKAVVPNLPKPMAPINGRPFLEHLMDYWIDQGIKKFILSVCYKKEIIAARFRTTYCDADIEYAYESEPLGTGGGMLLAANCLENPFLLLNGDTFFEVNLKILSNFHDKSNSDFTFSLFKADLDYRYGGVEIDLHDGRVKNLIEKCKIGGYSNGGVYIINPKIIKKYQLQKYYSLEMGIIRNLLESNNKLFGLIFESKFIDIGVPFDYYRAQEILL